MKANVIFFATVKTNASGTKEYQEVEFIKGKDESYLSLYPPVTPRSGARIVVFCSDSFYSVRPISEQGVLLPTTAEERSIRMPLKEFRVMVAGFLRADETRKSQKK
jgi:hypothetical protein